MPEKKGGGGGRGGEGGGGVDAAKLQCLLKLVRLVQPLDVDSLLIYTS